MTERAPNPSRRRLLTSLGVVTVGAGVGLSLKWRGGVEEVLHLRDLMADVANLQSLGTRYLELHPEDRDLRAVTAAVFGELPPPDERYDRALDLVRQRVRQDYVDGNTVRLDGWILTRTEGRLASLPLLLAAASGARGDQ
ncbi:MAG: hypothetical protein AAGN66_00410 [Acidobacteriota bacterium]